MTLLELCVKRIVDLLQNNYWPIQIHGFDENNPFASLPSDLNEKLVNAVVHNAHTGMLSIYLYPMLISGRIRNFTLESILMTHEELICILTTLAIRGNYLNSLILDEIQFLSSRNVHSDGLSLQVSSSIETLLSLSPNLKKLRIGLSFDLKVLQSIESLKQLELNFTPSNRLYDIIPKIDESLFIPNDTLTHLSIILKPQHIIPVDETAFILQYCPELTYINNNIAGGLELLHAAELSDGSLQKQYKLQQIILGDMFAKTSATASLSAVNIASMTCPNLKSLDILVNDHKVISALQNFENLETLLIQWEKVASPGDFRLSVQRVLAKIGLNLKKLCIIDFSSINFKAISSSCPNLESFKIEYHGIENSSLGVENSSLEVPSFQNLEALYLECLNEEGATQATLSQLLSSCQNLSCLSLENIPSLDDETLNQILTQNKLIKLSEVHLLKCSIGIEGLRSLINCCRSLKFLSFLSTDLEFEDAVDVVHELNPFIVMMD